MTETGTANWALGIHLIDTNTGVILSQEAYLKRVLIKYGFDESRPVATPIDNNVHLQKGTETEKIDDPTIYQSIIGSLMYAVIGTRPDLAYTVTTFSQFSSCPTKAHLAAVHRVLRYLKTTLDWSLFYAKTPPTALIGFSDASYASDIDDRRSFTGHCFMLGKALIFWHSYKQRSVATSTTEAEYMALSDTSRELIWLKNPIHELELKPKFLFIFRNDNNGSLSLIKNPVFHKRSKHIDVHFHFVRERYEDKLFELEYISTNENVVDLFTKGLDKGKHVLFSSTIHCGSRGEVLK
jgi:hypothetical protein